MVRLIKNNSQYKITVPIELVRAKGWASGTQFRFLEDEHGQIHLHTVLPSKSGRRGYTLIGNNKQFKLTVPIDVVHEKSWSAGTDIRFVEDLVGNVFLRPYGSTRGEYE